MYAFLMAFGESSCVQPYLLLDVIRFDSIVSPTLLYLNCLQPSCCDLRSRWSPRRSFDALPLAQLLLEPRGAT